MRRMSGFMGALLASAAMAMIAPTGLPSPYSPPKPAIPAQMPRVKKRKKRSKVRAGRWQFTPSKYKPHQGKRECARRMRQIAGGQLKPENRGAC